MLPMLRFNRPALADDFFRNNFLSDLFESEAGYSNPAVNIIEGKESFSIEVAAPGLDKNDFQINLERNVLTISSEKETEKEEKDGKYMRREFSYSTFKRSFTLPETVEYEKIVASHKNGILTVTIPKRDEAKIKPARQIDIS
ncbi:MAG: Hsp20/alpha crystallin family protein [Bacteroidota bacterium]|nr:Hsp20/alpha crystallin family protein [Bacteroidota bacterium]